MKYFRYHNTNCFFIESSMDGKLLAVDAGWPCTLYEYRKCLKETGYSFNQIGWAIATHFHMDHAGLFSEFIKNGIECFVFDNQKDAIDEMERIILKNKEYQNYLKIDKTKLRVVDTNQSDRLLKGIGVTGEIINTHGHSNDSISFITDNQEAIIGDLSPIDLVMDNDYESKKSWELLKSKGVRTIYPSHAGIFKI